MFKLSNISQIDRKPMALKKKILIIFTSVVAFLCLFTIAFQWYFNPSRLPEQRRKGLVRENAAEREKADRDAITKFAANLEETNGAKYYLEACLALVNTSGKDSQASNRLYEVIEKGWQKEEPGLEQLIEQNEPAFELVKKGLERKYCSMPEIQQNLSYLMGFRQIARLLVAKAKLCERKGAYDEAQETYLDVLHFGRDISDTGIIIHALVGMAIERLAYSSMRPYVNNLQDATVCQRLLDELIDLEKNRSPLHDVLQREFIEARKFYEGRAENVLYFRNPSESSTVIQYFTDTARRVAGYISVRLQMPKLLRERENFDKILLEQSKKNYPEIFDGHLEAKIPKDNISRLRFESMSTFIRSFARYCAVRRANIIKVALHEFYLKNGKYPQALEELAPVVPEEVLTDPFSMKHFVYRKTDAGYRFYSVGEDMNDDQGKPMVRKFPYSRPVEGDIVFEFPEPSSGSSEK